MNLGFSHRYVSKVSDSMWIDAIIRSQSAGDSVSINNLIHTQKSVPLKDIKLSDATASADSDINNNSAVSPVGQAAIVNRDSLLKRNQFAPKDSLTNRDSLLARTDSLALKDTVKVDSMAIDSTARLKYFHYKRKDLPYVTLKQKRMSEFFAQPSPGYKKRTVEIDSTGKYVIVKETIAGQQTKILLRMPIDDYIQMSLALHERKTWEDLGYAYELKENKTELSDVIKDITDFEIPLPSVGVLSIFGKPKISLKIGGAVDIHGAFRSETTEGVTTSLLGNTRSEPDFKQQVQINVNGTIGDKLNINADWNTERTFEYENQLKIKYTGYEDEIIQSIEAGNVSLETSPLIGGSEALFGLKAVMKMGPLTLTTLASQKKGEIKEVSVSGGSTSKQFTKRAYDYSTNHYFVDTVYASTNPDLNLFYKYYANSPPIVNEQYTIVDIQVWKSVNVITPDNSKERNANVYINLPALSKGQTYDDINPAFRSDSVNPVAGQIDFGRFLLLDEGTDYILHPETGYISFLTQIQPDDIIAVAYRVQNNPSTAEDDSLYGEFVTASTPTDQRLVLKMIKPKNLQPGWTQAWKLQLRNIYPTDSRNIKEEGFEFNIKYQIEGQEPAVDIPTSSGQVRLLNAFGLDLLDASKNENPDNVFDFRPGFTVIPETGEIIFPELEPFGRDLPDKIPKEFAFQNVYDTTSTSASNIKDKDKWILTGQSTGEATSSYSLGFNVVENSVKVSLDGRELTPNVDYSVDYNTGQLVIRNDAALVPGANLKITYEQNDLFQLASKTLLGARGVIDFSKKTKLGFTALNLNQQTLSDKVRIGEEPLSNSIYGVDFSTSADLPFLTKALDNIISTKQMSTFTLSGEYAHINPDPNTKKSTIISDQGKSIAYIDDFEGAKRTIPIGISYTGWKDLSPPGNLEFLPSTLQPQEEIPYKAKAWWYTITPGDVQVNQIWPNRKASKQDQQVTVMDFVFQPDTPGTYNPEPKIHENLKQNWGGMMKLLSSTANNLVEENIEYIEFWGHIDQAPSDAKVYIDLGNISEDVIPNRLLDTEDKKQNEVVDQGEDTGLDGIFDADERAKYGSTRADPNGDNFSYTPTSSHNPYDYFNINGTEGNANLSDNARIPDTEDLNRNGTLDLLNSYFRYAVPLDTINNPYIAGGGDNAGWYLFRIPLKDTATVVGNPSLTNIQSIRVFVTGVTSPVHIRMTEFDLVGSQWQKAIKEDTTLSVSVISYEDNPNYTLPPGVFQERDRSHPDENVLQNEQSLNLIIKDLQDGQSREAVRFLYRPLDVFNYSEMKLFIHGDVQNFTGSLSDTTNGYASQVYFRFGTDTNNYYEYRQPVLPGWNEISIPFKEITSLKQTRGDSTNKIYEKGVDGDPGHYYRLKGNPTLTAIQFLSVGVYNIKETGGAYPMPLSGDVWVNELRVIGADDSPGWAYSVNSSVRFADLFGLSFNMSKKNPYFHAISDRFGSRVESTNWSVASDFDVLKLLPFNLPESSLKINYSHSESLGKPLYVPGTDIRVDQAGRQLDNTNPDSITFGPKNSKDLENETQTLSISDSWSASNVKIKIPTNFWLIRDTFNGLSFGFNYNKTFSRNPTVLSNKSWIWNANLSYGLNLGSQYNFSAVDIPVLGSALGLFSDYRNLRIFFLPQTFTVNLTAKRNRNTNITRARKISGRIADAQTIVTRDFGTTRSFGFNWKVTDGGFLNLTTNYHVSINSSLAYLETKNLLDQNGLVILDQNGQPVKVQRSESDIWHDIFSRVWFGRDFAYQQSTEFRTQPRLPSLWDMNKYFTVTAGYSVNYNWNYDFRAGDLGRSAGFSSKSNVGFTLRLKALTEPLFKSTETETSNRGRENLVNNRNAQRRFVDTSKTFIKDSLVANDTSKGIEKRSAIKNAALFLESIAKTLLFDYESITINFTNNHGLSKSGIAGTGTGFNNFWGLTQNGSNGPTRAFMLGLGDDVGGRLALPNSNVSDVSSNSNSLDLRTSRPLWEGAKIDLNWKVGWSVNKTTTFRGDDNGNLVLSNVSSTGSLSRSFLSLPPFLFLSVFKNGIKKVDELYDPNSTDPGASLSSAFVQGFETFPWLSKLGFFKDVVKYIPRPNWSITWDGLEKFFLFKKIAKKVTFNHVYSSTYTEGWKITPDGVQQTQSQRIQYGFQPLAGLNFTFGEMWGGNLISSIKYSTSTNFDLGISNQNITETYSRDIGITAGYSKSGFELPLFGVSLKNDIEFTFSYTSTQNSIVRYEMNNFTEEGIPQDGTTRTTIEPRIKYTISSKVTLSIFYRRSSVQPEGASRVTPTVTNEAGLDVHISIQ